MSEKKELPKNMIKPVSEFMSEFVALLKYYLDQQIEGYKWALGEVDKISQRVDKILEK